MKRLATANFNLAREFVGAKARPVDQALFAFTFEKARPAAVWEALGRYANEDGGFGHAIEPDCRLPGSSVLGTITAFPNLVQTGTAADHPLVRNGIRYLLDVYDRQRQRWRMLPPEANDYPRAAWMNYDSKTVDQDGDEHWSNPSACAVACLHRYSDLVPGDVLREVTRKAMSVIGGAHTLRGHDYLPFIELAEAAPEPERSEIWRRLKRQAASAIVTDPAQWTGYCVRPLWAVTSPSSPLMEVLADSVCAQLDFEIDRQQPDGAWHPFWSWGRFEAEWDMAKVEWQGWLTVKALCSLYAFGRIG